MLWSYPLSYCYFTGTGGLDAIHDVCQVKLWSMFI